MTGIPKTIAPDLLLRAYTLGIFPMGDEDHPDRIDWFEPHYRGIIPLAGFHVSKNTRRLIRNGHFSVWANRNFRQVMRGCARREETWISETIIRSYTQLHQLGFAHSVEVYDEQDELVGGQYGVAMGGGFFGESTFQTKPEMHKVALYYTHQRLVERGFVLWDTQFFTSHLGQFGGIEIPQSAYLEELNAALRVRTSFAPADGPICLRSC